MGNTIKMIIASIAGMVLFKLLLQVDGWMMMYFNDSFLRVAIEIAGLVGLAIVLCAIIEKYVSFD